MRFYSNVEFCQCLFNSLRSFISSHPKTNRYNVLYTYTISIFFTYNACTYLCGNSFSVTPVFGKYEALNCCLVCADVAEKEQTEMNITFNSIISLAEKKQTEMNITFNSIISLKRNERVCYIISIDQFLFDHIEGLAQDCSNSHCLRTRVTAVKLR